MQVLFMRLFSIHVPKQGKCCNVTYHSEDLASGETSVRVSLAGVFRILGFHPFDVAQRGLSTRDESGYGSRFRLKKNQCGEIPGGHMADKE